MVLNSAAITVLLQRSYGLYTAGSTISLFGMWAHKLAAAWLAWKLTGSTFWVGVVAFADLFPTVLLTPFAGVIADRYNRLHLTMFSQACGMVQAAILAWLVLTGRLTQYEDVWWLVGWTLFLGMAWALNTAARLSMVPNLVEHRFVPPAVAINSAIFNLARVVGPAVGAWIIARWGVGEAFLFNAVTFIFFIAALALVKPVRADSKPLAAGNIFAQTADGIRYASRHPGIGPMLILLIAMALGGKSLLELLPEFADKVFGRGEIAMGELTAMAGAGGLVAAIGLSAWGRVDKLTQVTITTLLVTAAGVIGFIATDWYPLALASIFLLGVSGICGGTTTQTLMQHVVDDSIRGRVMSLYGVIHRGAPALGALIMGALAEVIGIRWAASLGGIACIGVWIWIAPKTRQLTEILEAKRER